MFNKKILWMATAGMLMSSGVASATTILFNDFSSTAGLAINGNAAAVVDDASRNVLRVTRATYSQGGSVFSTNAVSLDANASFSSAFKFRISQSGGASDGDGWGADGLVFAVQTLSNNVGGVGGGIGYLGIGNSVGIEFDTWNNGGGDAYNGNHVGIDLNGSVSSVALAPVAQRMNDGDIWSAWVDYNGASDLLEVRLALGQAAVRPSAAMLSYTTDLTSVLGSTNAFVGFTSGTGAAFGNHDVLAWQFNSTYNPITTIGNVPEPGVLALMSAGLLGFAAAARRRKA